MVSSRVSTCTAVIFICDAPRVVGEVPSVYAMGSPGKVS